MAHAAGALFHTDAVQAAGKVPIDVNATSVDMLSLSAHKFHGPKGVGALFVRSGMKFQPLILGGKQERGRRGGTENVPGIVGMGCAAAVAYSVAQAEGGAMAALRDRLEQGILRHVPDCAVAGDTVCRLPNTSAILCDGAEAEAILSGLDAAGVAASSGAACSSGAMQASHVLRAMAVPASAAFGAVRFSLSRYSTADDVDRVVEVLPRIVARARAVAVHAHGPRALSEVRA
jgi:cysteine desulfurase